MKIPNKIGVERTDKVSLARIVSEDSQRAVMVETVSNKSSKDS